MIKRQWIPKFLTMLTVAILLGCSTAVDPVENIKDPVTKAASDAPIEPEVITDTVAEDSDDPAIWINPANKEKSLVLGTDKDENGALYAFNLDGKIVKIITGLRRPNNVDVAYGFRLGNKKVDIAVLTERYTSKLRVYSLPDLKPIDGGGIPIFAGEALQEPMGIALYTRPRTGEIFAIVGRKEGPSGSYIWQYRLQDNGSGVVKGTKVRAFGNYSGINEIESIAVDNELGYVYYSDEGFGVRKYYADPAAPNTELATFGTQGFLEDHEGISIYKKKNGKGYIIVSDQQANRFQIFTREGVPGNPHKHTLVKIVYLSTIESDGSEVTSVELSDEFEDGLFVAMSDDKTFHFYEWEDIMEDDD